MSSIPIISPLLTALASVSHASDLTHLRLDGGEVSSHTSFGRPTHQADRSSARDKQSSPGRAAAAFDPHNYPFVLVDEPFAAALRATANDASASSSNLEDGSLSLAQNSSSVAQYGLDTLPLLHRTAHVITDGFAVGKAPHLTDWTSTGGAYFVDDARGASVAVLKPEDEEPFSINNPKKFQGVADGLLPAASPHNSASNESAGSQQHHQHHSPLLLGGAKGSKKSRRKAAAAASSLLASSSSSSASKHHSAHHQHQQHAQQQSSSSVSGPQTVNSLLKKGIFPGEGAAREVAAYLLDHGHFAGVPPTALVLTRHPAFHVSEGYLGLVTQAAAQQQQQQQRLQQQSNKSQQPPEAKPVEAASGSRAASVVSASPFSPTSSPPLLASPPPLLASPPPLSNSSSASSSSLHADRLPTHPPPLSLALSAESSTSRSGSGEGETETLSSEGSRKRPHANQQQPQQQQQKPQESASKGPARKESVVSSDGQTNGKKRKAGRGHGGGKKSKKHHKKSSSSSKRAHSASVESAGAAAAAAAAALKDKKRKKGKGKKEPGSGASSGASEGEGDDGNSSDSGSESDSSSTSTSSSSDDGFFGRLSAVVPSSNSRKGNAKQQAQRKGSDTGSAGAAAMSSNQTSAVASPANVYTAGNAGASASIGGAPKLDSPLTSPLSTRHAAAGSAAGVPARDDANAALGSSSSSSSGGDGAAVGFPVNGSSLSAQHFIPVSAGAASIVQLGLPPIKTASMQLYVPHVCTAEEVSSSLWPEEQVHRIAILDIRLGNTDRNDDNVLVRAFWEEDDGAELRSYEEEEARERLEWEEAQAVEKQIKLRVLAGQAAEKANAWNARVKTPVATAGGADAGPVSSQQALPPSALLPPQKKPTLLRYWERRLEAEVPHEMLAQCADAAGGCVIAQDLILHQLVTSGDVDDAAAALVIMEQQQQHQHEGDEHQMVASREEFPALAPLRPSGLPPPAPISSSSSSLLPRASFHAPLPTLAEEEGTSSRGGTLVSASSPISRSLSSAASVKTHGSRGDDEDEEGGAASEAGKRDSSRATPTAASSVAATDSLSAPRGIAFAQQQAAASRAALAPARSAVPSGLSVASMSTGGSSNNLNARVKHRRTNTALSANTTAGAASAASAAAAVVAAAALRPSILARSALPDFQSFPQLASAWAHEEILQQQQQQQQQPQEENAAASPSKKKQKRRAGGNDDAVPEAEAREAAAAQEAASGSGTEASFASSFSSAATSPSSPSKGGSGEAAGFGGQRQGGKKKRKSNKKAAAETGADTSLVAEELDNDIDIDGISDVDDADDDDAYDDRYEDVVERTVLAKGGGKVKGKKGSGRHHHHGSSGGGGRSTARHAAQPAIPKAATADEKAAVEGRGEGSTGAVDDASEDQDLSDDDGDAGSAGSLEGALQPSGATGKHGKRWVRTDKLLLTTAAAVDAAVVPETTPSSDVTSSTADYLQGSRRPAHIVTSSASADDDVAGSKGREPGPSAALNSNSNDRADASSVGGGSSTTNASSTAGGSTASNGLTPVVAALLSRLPPAAAELLRNSGAFAALTRGSTGATAAASSSSKGTGRVSITAANANGTGRLSFIQQSSSAGGAGSLAVTPATSSALSGALSPMAAHGSGSANKAGTTTTTAATQLKLSGHGGPEESEEREEEAARLLLPGGSVSATPAARDNDDEAFHHRSVSAACELEANAALLSSSATSAAVATALASSMVATIAAAAGISYSSSSGSSNLSGNHGSSGAGSSGFNGSRPPPLVSVYLPSSAAAAIQHGATIAAARNAVTPMLASVQHQRRTRLQDADDSNAGGAAGYHQRLSTNPSGAQGFIGVGGNGLSHHQHSAGGRSVIVNREERSLSAGMLRYGDDDSNNNRAIDNGTFSVGGGFFLGNPPPNAGPHSGGGKHQRGHSYSVESADSAASSGSSGGSFLLDATSAPEPVFASSERPKSPTSALLEQSLLAQFSPAPQAATPDDGEEPVKKAPTAEDEKVYSQLVAKAVSSGGYIPPHRRKAMMAAAAAAAATAESQQAAPSAEPAGTSAPPEQTTVQLSNAAAQSTDDGLQLPRLETGRLATASAPTASVGASSSSTFDAALSGNTDGVASPMLDFVSPVSSTCTPMTAEGASGAISAPATQSSFSVPAPAGEKPAADSDSSKTAGATVATPPPSLHRKSATAAEKGHASSPRIAILSRQPSFNNNGAGSLGSQSPSSWGAAGLRSESEALAREKEKLGMGLGVGLGLGSLPGASGSALFGRSLSSNNASSNSVGGAGGFPLSASSTSLFSAGSDLSRNNSFTDSPSAGLPISPGGNGRTTSGYNTASALPSSPSGATLPSTLFSTLAMGNRKNSTLSLSSGTSQTASASLAGAALLSAQTSFNSALSASSSSSSSESQPLSQPVSPSRKDQNTPAVPTAPVEKQEAADNAAAPKEPPAVTSGDIAVASTSGGIATSMPPAPAAASTVEATSAPAASASVPETVAAPAPAAPAPRAWRSSRVEARKAAGIAAPLPPPDDDTTPAAPAAAPGAAPQATFAAAPPANDALASLAPVATMSPSLVASFSPYQAGKQQITSCSASPALLPLASNTPSAGSTGTGTGASGRSGLLLGKPPLPSVASPVFPAGSPGRMSLTGFPGLGSSASVNTSMSSLPPPSPGLGPLGMPGPRYTASYASVVAAGLSHSQTSAEASPDASMLSSSSALLPAGTGRASVAPDSRRLRNAKRIELVPIDHGLSLPRITALDEVSCSWVTWRQSKRPLSAENAAYVAALDGRKDALLLYNALGDRIRPPCLLTLRVCTALLQEGVAAGLTLAEIGLMMVRGSGVGLLPSSSGAPAALTSSSRHYSFDSDPGNSKGSSNNANLSALEVAVKKAQTTVKKEQKTTKVHAERAALQTLAAHWQRLSAEIAIQMKQQQLATNTTAATALAAISTGAAAKKAVSAVELPPSGAPAAGSCGSSYSSAAGTPASGSPFITAASATGAGAPAAPPPLALASTGSSNVPASAAIAAGGSVTHPNPNPNISSAARIAAADAALLSVATSDAFKQAAALAAAAGASASGAAGGASITLSPDRAAAVAEAAQRQFVKHQLAAAAQQGKKPWNVKKGKGAGGKKKALHPLPGLQQQQQQQHQASAGNPLVNAMTSLITLPNGAAPSSTSQGGAQAAALLSPSASSSSSSGGFSSSSSSSSSSSPAPSFFSYHDAVVRHFIAAIRPHIESVLARRQLAAGASSSSSFGNYS